MDVARLALFSLLFVYSVSGRADFEYITPEQRDKLESQFNQAAFDPAADSEKLLDRKWTCDMFGARSHMQVQHGLKLYTLESKDGEWRNKGAQLVNRYKAESKALIGFRDRFEDQVKITKDGLLVSRLSLNDPAKTIIAYSVCKTL